jgi:serine/threonine-protein kinase
VLRRTLAIKLLAGTLGDSAEARERFLREARAVSRLDHPGIAAVHDFGEVDGSPFIAFQYVSGKTLGSLLARGPMDPARSCALIAEAADALAHAHARGVVHRDVTANNLMVRDDGRLIVVDFGLALPEGDVRLTRSAMAIGTLGYMAPETYRGEGVSIPSDIYGLGVVLYRMVTGQVPFEAPTFEAMMYRTLNDPVMPPSRVNRALPSALDAVVLRALARDPAQRQSSALELAEELRAVATSSPQAIRRDAASTIVTAAQEMPAPGSGKRRAGHRGRRADARPLDHRRDCVAIGSPVQGI